MYYIDIFSTLHCQFDQNPNFDSFLIFSNLINNKTKLHMTIYVPLDLYKSNDLKLIIINN